MKSHVASLTHSLSLSLEFSLKQVVGILLRSLSYGVCDVSDAVRSGDVSLVDRDTLQAIYDKVSGLIIDAKIYYYSNCNFDVHSKQQKMSCLQSTHTSTLTNLGRWIDQKCESASVYRIDYPPPCMWD